MAASLLKPTVPFSTIINAIRTNNIIKNTEKKKEEEEKKNIKLSNYSTDFSKLLNADLGAYNAPSSGGGGAINLSGIINSYNTAAQNKINAIKQSTSSSRQDLLTALQRFQESNKANMSQQREDYTAGRSSLEDSAFMENRANVANQASRGLGGSGLQQLAQLQNRIAAGKEVSTLAKKNQAAQDALRTAETQQEQDYSTNLNKLSANELANITAAQDEASSTINQLKYNESVRQKQAAASAAANAASYAQNYASQAQTYKQNYTTGLEVLKNLQRDTETKLQSAKSKTDKETVIKEAVAQVNAGLATNYGLDEAYNNTAIKNLNSLYKKYK